MFEHEQPLWKDDLNPRLISGNAIRLRWECRILEDQHASDWNLNAAQWRLSQRLSHNTVQENVCPGFGIDLDGRLKGDHRFGGFVAIDDVRQPLSETAMTVLERVRSRRYLQRDWRRSEVCLIHVDFHRSRRANRKSSTGGKDNRLVDQLWNGTRSGRNARCGMRRFI